jgi:SAM-dependent methyltransferase
LEYTGERIHLTSPPRTHEERTHFERYQWASSIVRGRVLDVACGTGYGSRLLARSAYLVAADLERRALMPLVGAASLSTVALNLPRLPFADRSFDYVVSFETIEHVDNDLALLLEYRRVVCTGGELLLSTPNRAVTSPDGPPANPFHIREYSIDALLHLIHQAGFEPSLFCQLQPLRGPVAAQARRIVARFGWCRPGATWDRIAHGSDAVHRFKSGGAEPMLLCVRCRPK